MNYDPYGEMKREGRAILLGLVIGTLVLIICSIFASCQENEKNHCVVNIPTGENEVCCSRNQMDQLFKSITLHNKEIDTCVHIRQK
jgi:hypothetical protein